MFDVFEISFLRVDSKFLIFELEKHEVANTEKFLFSYVYHI